MWKTHEMNLQDLLRQLKEENMEQADEMAACREEVERDFVIWKVPEAHGDRVIRIKTEGAAYPSVFCVVL